MDFSDNSAFDKEAQVLRAPELDDLDDTDNLVVMGLDGPSETEASTERLIAPTGATCGAAATMRSRGPGGRSTASSCPGRPGAGC